MSPFVRKIGSRYVMRILRILLLLNFLLAPGATFSQDKRLASAYADAKALTPSDVPPIQALAKSGNVAAEFKLGLAYQLGLVVTKDDAEAEKWLRKAVEQGDPQAEYCLGLLLSGQRSRSQESQEWIRKAAEQEDPAAQWLLGMHLQLAKDNASALKWFRAAADQGLDQAQVAVGYYYEKGVVVPQDFGMAAKWYRLAADQGLAVAQSNLGNFYVRGNGVPQDLMRRQCCSGELLRAVGATGKPTLLGSTSWARVYHEITLLRTCGPVWLPNRGRRMQQEA